MIRLLHLNNLLRPLATKNPLNDVISGYPELSNYLLFQKISL